MIIIPIVFFILLALAGGVVVAALAAGSKLWPRGAPRAAPTSTPTPPAAAPATPAAAPERRLVWDLPTRVFHWAFAGSILGAFLVAQVVDDESVAFGAHIVFGVVAGLLLAWRLVWGLVGSKHARFRALLFSPRELVAYLRSALTGRGTHYSAHNPASAVAIWAMLGLTAVTVLSGAAMGTYGKVFEEIHEVAAVLLMVVAGVHVAGVLLASFTHRENLAGAMLTGRKRAEPEAAIRSVRPLAAAVLVGALVAGTGYFVSGFDWSTKAFAAPGTAFTMQLGEGEDGERLAGPERSSRRHGDDDDDDD